MHRLRLAVVAALIPFASGCEESTVPRGQVVMNLTQVDGKSLPVTVPAVQGATAHINWGVIAGSSSGSTCDYRITYALGNLISGAEGSISDCRPKKGEQLTVKIVVNASGIPDEHTYTWGY